MSIRVTPLPSGGIVTVATGAGVDAFRLLSLRAMLRLEAKGMRHSGGPLRPRIAAEFGLKPRASYETYIEALTKRIEEVKQEVIAENVAEDAIAKAKQP